MKIYLAIPYTGFEDESFTIANRITARLMSKGHVVFSPISHNHTLANSNLLPKGWDYWKQFDKSFIEWCDEVRVVHMNKDGSERIANSVGVKGEVEIATELGKPIYYEFDVED